MPLLADETIPISVAYRKSESIPPVEKVFSYRGDGCRFFYGHAVAVGSRLNDAVADGSGTLHYDGHHRPCVGGADD
jgi:hypothetical protein